MVFIITKQNKRINGSIVQTAIPIWGYSSWGKEWDRFVDLVQCSFD